MADANHTSSAITEEALDAFWNVVTEKFPDVRSGDLSPERIVVLRIAAEAAIMEWIENNVSGKSSTLPS